MLRLLWLLLAAALAATVLLLRTPDVGNDRTDDVPDAPRAKHAPSEPTERAPYTDVCTLAVKVVDEHDEPLRGVTAGFRALGEESTRQTNARGEAVFTSVPAGMVEVFARAPKRREVTTRRPLPAGIQSDVRLSFGTARR